MTDEMIVTLKVPGMPPVSATADKMKSTMKILAARKSGIGHNSGSGDVGGVSSERLKQYIERVERLTEENRAISDHIKDIYREAKSFGFDVKVLRQVVKLRAMDTQKRIQQEELLDLYRSAIGL